MNTKSVGELWLGLLRFYALDYLHSDRVVCIRKKAPLKRLVKNWIGKRTAIEDPSSVKRNVARTIIHNNSFRYIMNCFRLSYLYYAIPRCEGNALYGFIQIPQPKLDSSIEYRKRMMKISQYWRAKMKFNALFSFDSSSSEKEVSKKKHKLPPIVCTICTMDGHSKTACPDAHLPPLPNLPPMTEEFQALLDSFCYSVHDISCQKSEDIECRKRILSELEDYIRGFYPDVQLSLFGSSANGFGFRNSDLDICLTFKSNPSGKVYVKVESSISAYFTFVVHNMRNDVDMFHNHFQVLGFVMKKFAKLCNICDASRGSLSSYAYILMVIYFLQQCDPPVLPVLQ
ncbi:hypothetical protein J437_LFUL014633, partial [Ladona fulva]